MAIGGNLLAELYPGRKYRELSQDEQLAYKREYNERNKGTIYTKRRVNLDKKKANAAIYRAKHKQRIADKRFVKEYGIDGEQRDALFIAQGSACALCKTTEPGGQGLWHMDHCHESGTVRGILCHNCNVGLGHFKDNVELLEKAIVYLKAARND